MNEIRLQLALAKAGLASRRHAEELITAGRVAVNDKIVTRLGTCVDPVSDRISVDGKPVLREAPGYFLLNKPKGYVTTAEDPEGRPTVFSLLPSTAVRLFPVGRLDYNTEGALLMTNDGELAFSLMHPSRGIAKVYHAKFRGVVDKDQITRLRRGVDLPPARPLDKDGRAMPVQHRSEKVERSAPADVTVVTSTGRHTWLQFILHEGKNRQIHRMAEAVGSSLLKLMRVEYAGLTLHDLPTGEARPLQPREVLELRQSVGLKPFVAQLGPQKPKPKPPEKAEPAARSTSRTSGRPAPRHGDKPQARYGTRPDEAAGSRGPRPQRSEPPVGRYGARPDEAAGTRGPRSQRSEPPVGREPPSRRPPPPRERPTSDRDKGASVSRPRSREAPHSWPSR